MATAFVLLTTNISSFAATPLSADAPAVTDEQYVAPAAPGTGYQGDLVQDSVAISSQNSYYVNFTTAHGTVNEAPTAVTSCTSDKDPGCAFTVRSQYSAILPMCSSANSFDCLSAITAKDSFGAPLAVNPIGTFPTDATQGFTGDPSVNLPSGSVPELVEIPGAPHEGGDQYIVRVALLGVRDQSNPNSFSTPTIQASFYAVKTISGIFANPVIDTNTVDWGNSVLGVKITNQISPALVSPTQCIVSSATECAVPLPLPTNVAFGFTLHLQKQITGWLHGRMKSPQVTIASNGAATDLTVSAYPIDVPVDQAWVANSALPGHLTALYSDGGVHPGSMTAPQDFLHINTDYDQAAMNEYLNWLPLFGDKAVADPIEWTLNSINNAGNTPSDNSVNKCLQSNKGLSGIVTTNATQYFDAPPTFNSATSSLDYKVAAAHFLPDGTTPFKGTYDLVMASSVARCIYGFTSAPVSASVAVVSASGTPDVATVVTGEKDGWLRLGAYNFTFSNPTISVKLSQNLSITCVKGKSVKTVSGAHPICPSGFKKK